ncbi:MAG TPA: carboxypeptidase regulatory-like domain-containing protein [Blastocatellia bacterium]|nr:carboxypeptidase regulatory-like domain-containing protein [Blastocatellia bacterium]
MRNRLCTLISFICGCALIISPAAFTQTATGTLTGTVKDPTGAVIAGAQVTVRNEATGETRSATTDGEGRFEVKNLAPGRYTVSVTQPGFKPAERNVTIEGARPAALEIRLEVAAPRVEVGVTGKGGVAPNSDPNYRKLRDGEAFESYSVNNLVLKRDVGVITLRSGRISFLPRVLERVTKAVFIGEGEFALTPAIPIERNYLRMIAEKDAVSETFDKAVFCFTDATYDEIKRQAQPAADQPGALDHLRNFHRLVRSRTERPRSLVQYLVAGDDIENLEAKILADLYNPQHPGFFSAYISGRNQGDLRFHVRPRGALPAILSPEEVALINLDPGGEKDGIWYMAHLSSEFQSGKASSGEDKRVIDAQHYRIETVIDGGEKLTASAEVTFTPLVDGERVLDFGLLPSLRVTRVALAGGREISFIQEPRKEDGSFYAVLPEPLAKGKPYKLTIEYQGNKVVEDAGGGNFFVGARTSWYPSVNSFTDRATYDLTFKVPNKYTLVGVGKQVKSWREGDFAASQWVSDVPLAVAGFNYATFKKKEIKDEPTKYAIEGYATTTLPSFLQGADEIVGGLTPTRLLDNAMVEAQYSMRLFTHWFGEAPYGRIAITQQPQAFFGQSWPTLVYLPIIAFFDSTQRWMLMGRNEARLTEFIQEVTPHEVAHQWWGHIVGWASYHDQWLSEGFADFSAGVYLQAVEGKPDRYLKFLERWRERILTKNQWGRRPNDAGPIWMGLRLNTYKTAGAYSSLVYPKGGYILHMLRMMMQDPKTGDERFIEMMRDFVKTHYNQNASTESFKRTAEKYMTKTMDVDQNGRLDWFFSQWVYGIEVPSYKFEYKLTPESGSKVLLTARLTQSGVSESFIMLVPIYLDFDGKVVRLGQVTINGNSTSQEIKVRLPQKPKRVLINAYHDVLAVESVSIQN